VRLVASGGFRVTDRDSILDPEPFRRRFDNGTTFLARGVEGTRAFVLGIWVKTGSRDETGSLGGMSHFIEHMVFKGTTTRSAFEIALAMESVGGSLEAYTTKEYTCYYARVLAEHAQRAVDIVTDLVLRPTFLEESLALEKNVVLEEIANVFDTPDDWIHEIFSDRMYGPHPVGRPILGTRESVSGFDREKVRAFYAEAYVGGNVIVSAAGALEPERLAEEMETRLSLNSREFERNGTSAPSPSLGEHWEKKELGQQYICLGAPGISYREPDRYAVLLLVTLLGGGMSSRLFQKVREEAGLAYSVYSYADFYLDTGHLATFMAVRPENAEKAVGLVREEMRSVRENGVAPGELESAREQIKGRVLLGMESTTSKMARLAKNEIYYGRHVSIEETIRILESITVDDLKRVAGKLLAPDRTVLVGLGPRGSASRSADG
jgi:predicted Zn-dependent peptidase